MKTFSINSRARIASLLVAAATLSVVSFPTFAMKSDTTGLYGGGSCSIWQKMKSMTTGVYCGYL